jgi:predicted TIM-barrel fold metal-dependent hydrolase
MQASLISLVMEGVFERFPTLRVVSAENGFAWVPALCWRLDSIDALLHDEVPHLQRRPSEYIRDHVWFCTQPIEEPPRTLDLLWLIDQVGAERLLFATDYAHWDWDAPDAALPARLPALARRRIFYENARELYRLPAGGAGGA